MLCRTKDRYTCAFKLIHKKHFGEKRYYPRFEISGQDIQNYVLVGPNDREDCISCGLMLSKRDIWRVGTLKDSLSVKAIEILFGDEILFVFDDCIEVVTEEDLQKAAEEEENADLSQDEE